jgi:hypothetical protein
MPANGLATVASKVGNGVQEVRWVGGWRGGFGWRGVGWRGAAWRGVGWRGAAWRGGWGRGLYAYAGPAWQRPLYAGAGWRWNRWGWRRPFVAAATVAAGVGLATAAWDAGYYADNTYNAYYADTGWNTGYNLQSPYYANAGPTWGVGYNPGWGWRGWGFRGSWW